MSEVEVKLEATHERDSRAHFAQRMSFEGLHFLPTWSQ